MSWSEEEYQAYQERLKHMGRRGKPATKDKPKSKYGAKRTKIDGLLFDSKKEADYYSELKLLQMAGEIDGFCMQPIFLLQEGMEERKPITYRADFIVFYPDGTYEIIDTKGMETDVFKLKEKMFNSRYPHLDLIKR